MGLSTEIERALLGDAIAQRAPSCTIAASARIGSGTVVGPNVVVDAQAVVGDDCVLECGAHIGRGTVIERGVFIGAHVAFATPFASPFASPFTSGAATVQRPVVVKAGAWIGANASIAAAGIVIGAQAVVRPGAVVTRSVPPGAIVEGNPANIIGYRNASAGPAGVLQQAAQGPAAVLTATPVKGVTVHHFPVIHDPRGNLSVGEFDRQIPFKPLRYFLVFDVPSRELRGEHAHHRCHQFLICLRGSCAVLADDGEHRVEVALDSPQRGVHLPPLTWGVQYKYSADAMLLVFASDHYDAADYIRDYGDFLALVQPRQGA